MLILRLLGRRLVTEPLQRRPPSRLENRYHNRSRNAASIVRHLRATDLRGLTKPNDGGNIDGSRAKIPFMSTAVDLRLDRDFRPAPTHGQCPDSLRSVQLVRAERHEVHGATIRR